MYRLHIYNFVIYFKITFYAGPYLEGLRGAISLGAGWYFLFGGKLYNITLQWAQIKNNIMTLFYTQNFFQVFFM